MSEWISVEERMPKERGLYLIVVDEGSGPFTHVDEWINGDKHYSGGWVETDGDFITHWMPFPEPPSRGQSAGKG